jgi:hypothetical protein
MKKTSILILFLFLINTVIIFPDEYNNKNFGYFLDIPVGWKIVDSKDSSLITFNNENETAVFNIFSFKGDQFKNADEIFNYINNNIFKANGEVELFNFSGKESIFSDLSFEINSLKVRGYCICINGQKYDFVLIAYSDLENYEKNHDFLLSSLNSFSLDNEGKILPGPVMQYYYTPISKNKNAVKLVIEGKTIDTFIDYDEIEETLVLIDREHRILSGYKKDQIKAWNRYYNIIYRDNYSRVNEQMSVVLKTLNLDKKNKKETVKRLVYWIQNFKFTRDAVSDITSPLECFYSFKGDCDSRVLLLLTILHQMDIDAIMLVSIKYQHAIIGINIEGNGTKISFNNKSYLIVNLNIVMDMGVYPDKMNDPSEWIPMKIGY